jgi:hypothetical protein
LSKETYLKSRVKQICSAFGIENMRMSALNALQEGVIVYMQQIIEELVEVSRASRAQNVFMHRNITPGQILQANCYYDQGSERRKNARPVDLQMICVGNPRQQIESNYLN